MKLVNSYMSKEEIKQTDLAKIIEILSQQYGNKYEIQKLKYEDRKYYEVDVDLLDVNFSEERIYKDMDKLIQIHEKVLSVLEMDVDIIVANDDTDTEILIYENDSNNIGGFGLFITKRDIPNIEPYYSSDVCKAFLNFENVSFGVIF